MKIMLCHNFYQQKGGEDQVYADESRLLEENGHTVIRYTQHNNEIKRRASWQTASHTIWNNQTYKNIGEILRKEKPDIIHCTNTFPLISPAIYYSAQAASIAIVQTLHNFRLLCPNAIFLRNGKVCEKCLHKTIPWPAVVHKCYRENAVASTVVATMLSVHRKLGTYKKKIDRYIALTEFARKKFIEGGLPSDKIEIKPNFIDPDPGLGKGEGNYGIFVGRLSPEKGIDILIEAWSLYNGKTPLKIVGKGPLEQQIRAAAEKNPAIEYLGYKEPKEVLNLVGEASFLLFPSIWFEGLPKTILESFSKGTPVIASRLGSQAELISDGSTGFLFDPGNPRDLVKKIHQVLDNPLHLRQMRRTARLEYEMKYSAKQNYQQLINIYQKTLNN